METVNYAELRDQLLGEGRSTFIVADVVERSGASANAVYGAIKYATDRRRLFSPVRGLYVIVPPEYRRQGVVPATHFIDPMMTHLGVDYYVGYAAAAQWWGAAHQAPQVVDVVGSRTVLDRDLGGVRLRFHTRSRIDSGEVRRVAGPRTMFNVASPNLVAVDMATRPDLVGGLSAVATILAELEDLDGARLGWLAEGRSRSVARRLGWLVSLVRDDLGLTELRQVAQVGRGQPTPLASNGNRNGPVDPDWAVAVNATVEPDEL